MNDNQNSRTYSIIIAFLLLLSAVMGYFFWQKSKNFVQESAKLEAEKTELQAEKTRIEHSLDSLSTSYADLRTENETLRGTITSTAALIQEKDAVIRQIRTTSANDVKQLRDQVSTLEKTKIEYETIISALRGENDALKAENQRLTGENATLKGNNTALSSQVDDLAKKLEEQIRKTQSATFKASSFRVTPVRRNDKLTAKARRVRSIDVSFDLADVPANFQGTQKIYLVITDEKGVPIVSEGSSKATIHAPAAAVEITAQQLKTVVLESMQRLSFNFKFDDRLKSGAYVVAIYCDQGLLGASSFRLS